MDRSAAVCFALTALASCGAPAVRRTAGELHVTRAANYRFSVPAMAQIAVTDADVSFESPAEACTLLVNSRCGMSFDIPLRALTQHLLIGFTDRNEFSAETGWTMERDALHTKTWARLDGVPIEVWTHVWKRDLCVYDVVLTHAESRSATRPEVPTESHMPARCAEAQAVVISSMRAE